MANLKEIRKRIGSVKSTEKITRAMKMIAGARLRKAQQNIEQIRPYAKRTLEVLSEVASRTEAGDHPLLARREPKKVLLLVLTSDRGLCGGFNGNINRAAEAEARARRAAGAEVVIDVVGRKGRDYFRRRPANTLRQEIVGIGDQLSAEKAAEIGRSIVNEYIGGGFDFVGLVYNEFKSAMSQRVVVEPLLPVQILPGTAERDHNEFIYEPNKTALLDRLPGMYVNVEIYRALLESAASELGARMTAMENATKNAGEMINRLTLLANRTRQAAITKELLEVVAGADALKG